MGKPGYDGGSLDDLVNAADDSVKMTLNNGRGLRDFLSTIDKLEPEDFELIVGQATRLLESFYVHLPMKRAMHAIDPLQRLRLLRRRLPQLSNEITFHHELTDIFTSLRDLHTNYILPTHFAGMVAFLPFRVEACYNNNGIRQYILAQTVPGFAHQTFVQGVELNYWNGVPIARAVEIAAYYHAGSNPAARHARGVAGLTKRAMNISPPPDEEWVVVGYEDQNGQQQEFRADWTITALPPELDATAPEGASAAAAAFGIDLEGDTFRRINKMLFAQHVVAAQRTMEQARQGARTRAMMARAGGEPSDPREDEAAVELEVASTAVQGTQSTMPEAFSASVVEFGGRKFGYIRIVTFSVRDDRPFVNEFLRLIELPEMPKDGLIIDVRGNGGGLIWAGERLLQLLTPRPIEPCRVQFINTPANLELCEAVPDLRHWAPSLARAVETGAAFSAAFPITPPERCNDIGQRYYGPVLLITDARCYSTTDIFAAGFQDHKIGPILGTDNNTGAGGANVWTLGLIQQFFLSVGRPSPLQSLPKGADMRVAIRRTLRVGDEAGTELEDLGVTPTEVHQVTRKDTLEGNIDLLDHAARVLTAAAVPRPPVRFAVSAKRAATRLTFNVAAGGIDYLDVFIDRRARASHNVVAGWKGFSIPTGGAFPLPVAPVTVELRGYSASELVCYRRLSV